MEHKTKTIHDGVDPLKVDPKSIECGYLLYSEPLGELIASGDFNPHDALETNQPRLWPIVRNLNPNIKIHLFMSTATVEVGELNPALKEVGYFDGYSVAVGMMKFSLDGGETREQMYAGFCMKSSDPEIIILRADGAVSS